MNSVTTIVTLSEDEKFFTDRAVILMMDAITNALTGEETLPDETCDKFMNAFYVLAEVHRKLQ